MKNLWVLCLIFGSGFFSHAAKSLIEELKRELPEELQILGPELFLASIEAVRNLSRVPDSTTFCNGRLTLTSGTSVTTSNVTAATTVYFTPQDGNKISLYDGSKWLSVTFSETSVAVPATTVTPFDIFGYSNSGTLALETLSWSNDTTRATALGLQNGVQVKSGAATRRYLGTARTTSVSGQTEDSDSKRFLWNKCNRVPRKLLATGTTATWNYGTQAYRAANNSTTTGVTRVEYIVGVPQEPIRIIHHSPEVRATSPLYSAAAIGINSTTTNSADAYGTRGTTENPPVHASYQGIPSTGYSYAQWIEYTETGTTTFYGYFNDATYQLIGGILGTIWN